MNVTGLIMFILFMLVAIGSFAYTIYNSVSVVKDRRKNFDFTANLKKIAIFSLIFVVSFICSLGFIFLINNYSPNASEYLKLIIAGLLFSVSICWGTNSFIIYYYRKELSPKLDKALFTILMISIPVAAISFLFTFDAFADVAGGQYLLPNGINFTQGFVYPNGASKPHIAFYAICILCGALLSFALSDHYMYKVYHKHGTITKTFVIALAAGILGARIAYVIGNWSKDGFNTRVANGQWWCIFAIWEGGLTILGGAIAGIAVGALAYKLTNKGRSIWVAVDLIVPTILIAQAIGRWGNFFNCEVHGGLVDESYWHWLPKFIFNNAHYSSAKGLGWAPDGYLYAPLFFIESLVNLFGYFVLAHLFGKRFKNILEPGDLGFGYVIWYGFTRVFMEPLRDQSFNMGNNNFWSWIWSLVFVGAGSLLIVVNHFIRFFLDKDKHYKFNEFGYGLGLGLSIGLTAVCLSIGLTLMSNYPANLELALSNYNIGIILVVVAASGLLFTVLFLTKFIYVFKKQNEAI